MQAQQHLLTRLQKKFSSCAPEEERPHAGPYNHNKANRTSSYEMV